MQLSLFQSIHTPVHDPGRAVYTPGYRVMLVKDQGVYAPANVSGSAGAAEMFRKLLAEKGSTDREHFMVLMLNGQNMILGFNMAAIGGHNCAQVRLPEIFRVLLLAGAPAFVVGHNHPSGCDDPSIEDMNLTREIMKGARILGLNLLDHIMPIRLPQVGASECDSACVRLPSCSAGVLACFPDGTASTRHLKRVWRPVPTDWKRCPAGAFTKARMQMQSCGSRRACANRIGMDHIILADFKKYYSFADDGRIREISREMANG